MLQRRAELNVTYLNNSSFGLIHWAVVRAVTGRDTSIFAVLCKKKKKIQAHMIRSNKDMSVYIFQEAFVFNALKLVRK